VAVGPFAPIYLLPARGTRLTADRATASIGEVLKYQIVLTSTGAYSSVQMILPLPTMLITNVIATANHGQSEQYTQSLSATDRTLIHPQIDVAAGTHFASGDICMV